MNPFNSVCLPKHLWMNQTKKETKICINKNISYIFKRQFFMAGFNAGPWTNFKVLQLYLNKN